MPHTDPFETHLSKILQQQREKFKEEISLSKLQDQVARLQLEVEIERLQESLYDLRKAAAWRDERERRNGEPAKCQPDDVCATIHPATVEPPITGIGAYQQDVSSQPTVERCRQMVEDCHQEPEVYRSLRMGTPKPSPTNDLPDAQN